MKQEYIVPVLPSQDINRDIKWYVSCLGFELLGGDNMYAVLKRDSIFVHLQWHADTDDDPLLGGSVIKIFVEDIQEVFVDMVHRGTVSQEKLRLNTAWGTHEFGLFDLNKNAIFFVESL